MSRMNHRPARGSGRRSSGRRIGLLLLALLPAALAACGTARRGVPATGEPVRIEDPAAQRGQQVFMHTCNPCHPGGEAGLGPALNNKPLPGFLIRAQVRSGGGAMPAFPEEDLPGEDLDAIIDFLGTMRRADAD